MSESPVIASRSSSSSISQCPVSPFRTCVTPSGTQSSGNGFNWRDGVTAGRQRLQVWRDSSLFLPLSVFFFLSLSFCLLIKR